LATLSTQLEKRKYPAQQLTTIERLHSFTGTS